MNNTVYYDPACSDEQRRRLLFDGQLIVYSPRPSALAFVTFARNMIEEAFAPLDPETAQHRACRSRNTPRSSASSSPSSSTIRKRRSTCRGSFRRAHQRSREDLLRRAQDEELDESGLPHDRHRVRVAPASRHVVLEPPGCRSIGGYRSTRSSPRTPWRSIRVTGASQSRTARAAITTINGTSCIAARTSRSWSRKILGPCRSRRSRSNASPSYVWSAPVGGVIMFSGAQLHSSVPNTSGKTRFSFDFRVVHEDDVSEKRGAPIVDEECTGTTMRDYLRGTDLLRAFPTASWPCTMMGQRQTGSRCISQRLSPAPPVRLRARVLVA